MAALNSCGHEIREGKKFCGVCGAPVLSPAAPEAPMNKVTTAECPSCKQPLPMGALFCQKCGSKTVAAPTPVAATPGYRTPACDACGTPIIGGAAFCGKCGAPFASSLSKAVEQPEPLAEPVDKKPVGEKKPVAKQAKLSIEKPTSLQMKHILVLKTDAGTKSYPLIEKVTVGRSPENDIVIDDDLISRKHACLAVIDGKIVLTDNKSTNGTVVHGEVVTTRELVPGDKVTIGSATITLKVNN